MFTCNNFITVRSNEISDNRSTHLVAAAIPLETGQCVITAPIIVVQI